MLNTLQLLSLIVSLGQGVLASLKVAGIAPEILAEVQIALDALAKVHGTLVTKPELEALRTEKLWPDA